MKNFITLFLRLVLTGAIIGIAIGYLGHLHPAFDTIAHFRLHLSVGLIVLFFLLLFMRNRLSAIACLSAGAIGFWGAFSGTPFSATTYNPIPGKPVYSMVHFNLFWRNDRTEYVINRIREIDPLFISFSEVSESWKPVLESLDDRWPHRIHCAEFGIRGGIRLYSKLPMDNSNDYCGDYGSFMKTTVMLRDGNTLDLASVHPRWPWPASGPGQYASFTTTLENLASDALIAGDFNATTWSFAVQNFAQKGRLQIFDGVGSTWLVGEFSAPIIRLLGLPIDNVMHKGRVKVLSAKTLESWGSDHLPVLIRFQID